VILVLFNAANVLADVTCDPLGGGGEYQPAETLSNFNSGSTLGDWRLKLNDSWGGDPVVGVLQNWSLKICIQDYIAVDVASDAPIVLPLELLNFHAKAKEKSILLDWEVMNEKDISGYEIERREMGETNFHSIGFVNVDDTQNEKNKYTFEDEFIDKGILYQYRLRILDFSGAISYSNIREAKIAMDGISLNIYPNPSHGVVNIDFWGVEDEIVGVELIDIAGKRLGVFDLNLGNNTFDFSNFSKGIYFIKTMGRQSFLQQKLVIH